MEKIIFLERPGSVPPLIQSFGPQKMATDGIRVKCTFAMETAGLDGWFFARSFIPAVGWKRSTDGKEPSFSFFFILRRRTVGAPPRYRQEWRADSKKFGRFCSRKLYISALDSGNIILKYVIILACIINIVQMNEICVQCLIKTLVYEAVTLGHPILRL